MSTAHSAPHSVSGPITPTDALAFWCTVRSVGVAGLCKEDTLCANCGGEIAPGNRTGDTAEALGAAVHIEDGAIVCPVCGKTYPIELGSLISEKEAELLGLPIHIDGGDSEHIESTERPASRRER